MKSFSKSLFDALKFWFCIEQLYSSSTFWSSDLRRRKVKISSHKSTKCWTDCKWLRHRPAHVGCWRLALSVCSVSGLEQADGVSVSPAGSSYLQPSAGPVNNTCIRLPGASHLTSLPHYNYEPCNPAGEPSPAGNSRPGGPAGSLGRGRRGDVSFPFQENSTRAGHEGAASCPSSSVLGVHHMEV